MSSVLSRAEGTRDFGDVFLALALWRMLGMERVRVDDRRFGLSLQASVATKVFARARPK